MAERTGIEPAKLLHPAAFKAVSSTNRTLSLCLASFYAICIAITNDPEEVRTPDPLRDRQVLSTAKLQGQMERIIGFEPMTSTLARLRSTTELNPQMENTRVELVTNACKASVLPLN